MNTIGLFLHNNDESNKDINEDGNELKVIPVSDDLGYCEFLAFLESDIVSHTNKDQDHLVAETPPLPQSENISHSVSDDYKVLGAQHLSEDKEKDTASAFPQENPIGATFNWIGSLFHNEKEDNGKSCEDERIIPVSDEIGYQEFISFLKT